MREAVGYRRNVFIHSPYPLNLSNPDCTGKKEGEICEEPWVVVKAKEFLNFGEECGISGIVIHVGKKAYHKDPYENMKKAVKLVLRDAPLNCPLLIETPAGQKEFHRLGYRGVPVIKVGNEFLQGFDHKAFQRLY